MPKPLQLDPDAICDACGCFGAFRFDGETLCADCYANRGSCCSAEFSGREPDKDAAAPRCDAGPPPPTDSAPAPAPPSRD